MNNLQSEPWLSKRKVGWQAIIVFLIILYLFSLTTDPIPFLGFLRDVSGISTSQIKLLLNIPFYLILVTLWIFNNKTLFRKFIIAYVLIDMVILFLYIFELINTIDFFRGNKGAYELMIDVITIWVINVLIFGLLYWILDSGGPYERTREQENREILFPQFTLSTKEAKSWKPNIIDYITLAFTTATAFGPTDTYFLSRRFKLVMIIQVITSLTIITVLATRAATIIK